MDHSATAEASDADLVLAVRRGEHDSFAVLYQRHHRMAVQVARRAGLGADDTDDAVAEAFAKVFRALRRGHGPTDNFPGYLATSVRRVAWGLQRDAARTRPTDDFSAFDAEAVGPDPDALRDSAAGEALAALPPSSRTLLWRVEVEGHRIHDIADELGKTPNSVSAATSRARKRLRREYARRAGAA